MKDKENIIRSSKVSLKFSNKTKKDRIKLLINEYKKIVQEFIDILWTEDKIPTLLPKNITERIQTWLSARMIQSCGKQASGIVRGSRIKQNRREYIYKTLIEKGHTRKARKLKKIIEKNKLSKPNINNICPELDFRFVKIDMENKTSFDIWITLTSLGNRMKIQIPVKRTKHFNALFQNGVLKDGIRLSENSITFNFMIEKKENQNNKVLGIDLGITNLYALSDGKLSVDDPHGWNLTKINQRLMRRNKGSIGFRKAQSLRDNYIGWSLNQINLSELSVLRCEKLSDLRRGEKPSRFMSHWVYRDILRKLEDKCEENDVQLIHTIPVYTSQRCSLCGWVRKNNRKGKEFKCGQCENQIDADLNASRNIVLSLPPIWRKDRLKSWNRRGFYWCRNNILDNKIEFDPVAINCDRL